MGRLLLIIGKITILLSMGVGWWGQLLLAVVFEGGESVIETGGGIDLRSGEKRWRDRTLITDTTCREYLIIVVL
jgi:hypothetical protein